MDDKITTSPVITKKEGGMQEKQLTFLEVLKEVVQYKKATKLEWGDKDLYFIELKDGVLMLHNDKGYHQWIISEADLTGTDWVVVE